MVRELILVANILALACGIGAFIIALKLRRLLTGRPFDLIILATGYGSSLKFITCLQESEIVSVNPSHVTAAYVIFWMLFFASFAGLYYGLKKFLKVK